MATNNLTYPLKVMRITQGYAGSYSHAKYYKGSPNDYPIDDAGKDSGKDGVFCPCDKMQVKRVYGVGNSGTNTIWLESTSKVNFANGKTGYATLMIVHPNDSALKGIKVGDTFKRGQKITTEGTDGHATGNHVHMSVGKGKFKGNGWVRNSLGGWPITTTQGAMRPEAAFFVDPNFTKIMSAAGLKFTELADDTSVVYYNKCSSKCTSLVDGLKEIGAKVTLSNRTKIAKRNGISGYTGTAEQNKTLLSLLKQGKLIKKKG